MNNVDLKFHNQSRFPIKPKWGAGRWGLVYNLYINICVSHYGRPLVTFITTSGGLCMRGQLFSSFFSLLSCKLEQTKLHSLNLRWLKTESSNWSLNLSMQKRLLLRKAEWTPTITPAASFYSPSSRESIRLVYNPHNLWFSLHASNWLWQQPLIDFPLRMKLISGQPWPPRLTIKVQKRCRSVAPTARSRVDIMFLRDIFCPHT